ncbi:MAG: hypothetical protein ACT4SY_01515 [Hyphomicrobiales bacterium]
MRSLLALLALTISVGSAAACDMHRSHAAVLAAASTLTAPMPGASAAVTSLPQSRMEEEAALAVSKPELAAAPYRRGCLHERQTTVYLTQ